MAQNIPALTGGLWRARSEVKRVLETFDGSWVDVATLSALVAGGMPDLAAELAGPGRGRHLGTADSAACAAAAGQWSAALLTLMAEFKGSIYHPR